jgi:hypothetical protein
MTLATCSAGPAEIGLSAEASGIDCTATASGAAPPDRGWSAAPVAGEAWGASAALMSSSGISIVTFMPAPYAAIA